MPRYATPDPEIEMIEPRRPDLDQDFPRSGSWAWNLRQRESSEITMLLNSNGVHRSDTQIHRHLFPEFRLSQSDLFRSHQSSRLLPLCGSLVEKRLDPFGAVGMRKEIFQVVRFDRRDLLGPLATTLFMKTSGHETDHGGTPVGVSVDLPIEALVELARCANGVDQSDFSQRLQVLRKSPKNHLGGSSDADS